MFDRIFLTNVRISCQKMLAALGLTCTMQYVNKTLMATCMYLMGTHYVAGIMQGYEASLST